MKNKLFYANFNAETGESKVTIQNKYGLFSGKAFLHNEDADYPSKFVGCEYAETRAMMKYLKHRINILKNQIAALEACYRGMTTSNHFNENSFEAKHIQKEIRHLEGEKARFEGSLDTTINSLKLSIKEREKMIQASKRVKMKKEDKNK